MNSIPMKGGIDSLICIMRICGMTQFPCELPAAEAAEERVCFIDLFLWGVHSCQCNCNWPVQQTTNIG